MIDRSALQKIGAVCGFAVPIIAFGSISAAIVSYPEFSWTGNALSDLGVVPGITAIFFNLGLLIAGLLCFFFAAAGLMSCFKNSVVGKIGAIVFAAAAVWLMAIGVFNENFWSLHFIVAVLFFVTLPIALWVLMAALYLRREVKLAVFTLFSSFAAAVPWLLYFIVRYAPNLAIPEIISGLVGSIWIVVISYKIFKTDN
ncbi:MAG: DUF998 domain-containing protein [Methanimicrococcus sp.]|nr:DUF998 domain-containing protein [Methanimicrococcus sp.]